VGFCDGQKCRWGMFSPRTSVSPSNIHSICFSTIIFTITRGWHNRSGVAAAPIASQTGIKKKLIQTTSYRAYVIYYEYEDASLVGGADHHVVFIRFSFIRTYKHTYFLYPHAGGKLRRNYTEFSSVSLPAQAMTCPVSESRWTLLLSVSGGTWEFGELAQLQSIR
jgi:hypothetical protein